MVEYFIENGCFCFNDLVILNFGRFFDGFKCFGMIIVLLFFFCFVCVVSEFYVCWGIFFFEIEMFMSF